MIGSFPGDVEFYEALANDNRNYIATLTITLSDLAGTTLTITNNELWENGRIVKTPFDNLIGLSDATEIWKLNESTLRKAISYGKLRIGRDVCNYGKQWVVTKAAMIREYGYPEQNYSGFQAVAEEVPKYGK